MDDAVITFSISEIAVALLIQTNAVAAAYLLSEITLWVILHVLLLSWFIQLFWLCLEDRIPKSSVPMFK